MRLHLSPPAPPPAPHLKPALLLGSRHLIEPAEGWNEVVSVRVEAWTSHLEVGLSFMLRNPDGSEAGLCHRLICGILGNSYVMIRHRGMGTYRAYALPAEGPRFRLCCLQLKEPLSSARKCVSLLETLPIIVGSIEMLGQVT